MKYLINGFRGLCMALADSVPGVSGGTIAFILGFYDKFINSLDSMVFGSKDEKKQALSFLIKLAIGWFIGLVLASLILTRLFEKEIYSVSSVFLGFIIFSIPVIIKEEIECLKGKYKNIIFTVIGLVFVCLITYFNPVAGSENIINTSNLNVGLVLYVFVSAMIAISAMVLPGISGSTILLIFGLYIPIMTAIKGFLHFEMNYLPILTVFGFGVLTGIVLIIKTIKKALAKYRTQTVYLIIGLMLGSLYAIVMGPTTLETPVSPMSLSTFNFIFFILGGVIILFLEKVKKLLQTKNIDDN